jgi:hypothetical protein
MPTQQLLLFLNLPKYSFFPFTPHYLLPTSLSLTLTFTPHYHNVNYAYNPSTNRTFRNLTRLLPAFFSSLSPLFSLPFSVPCLPPFLLFPHNLFPPSFLPFLKPSTHLSSLSSLQYTNKAWTDECGWESHEVLGLTCAFLQGEVRTTQYLLYHTFSNVHDFFSQFIIRMFFRLILSYFLLHL